MDGYAVQHADLHTSRPLKFRQVGQSLAGHPFTGSISHGQCVRIFTGAQVPAGADQVLLQEEVLLQEKIHDAQGDWVSFNNHQPPESYVRPIGHDICAGAPIVAENTHLNAFALGSLAAAGVNYIEVIKQPVVGVFSTGDELVDPGVAPEDLLPGQIYDSNRFTVLNLLAQSPCELIDLGRLPDEQKAVEQAFEAATQQCDVLITSGGVSVGDADFITSTIATLGQLEFWRLNLKPGKPLAVGRIGNCHIFGLPGNPVSTIVTLLLVAKPAIWHLAGCSRPAPLRIKAILDTQLSHSPGRAEYQRGCLVLADGLLHVSSTGDQSSNRLRSFSGANCLVEIDKDSENLAVGCDVNVIPFENLLN